MYTSCVVVRVACWMSSCLLFRAAFVCALLFYGFVLCCVIGLRCGNCLFCVCFCRVEFSECVV